ncbi:MAG: hypothetical protein HKL90_00345 [Elusimicrobia bacterium]|nr:hypothetical protein [Elusimicrobiota bacterium]
MLKTMVRKQTPRKNTRVRRAVKAHPRRASAVRPAKPVAVRPMDNGLESQTLGDEDKLQSQSRAFDDSDAEAGIYGLKRGENAG